jgi:hypothetical protein
MSRQLSTVIVAEPIYAPGKFCLLRTDFPDPDNGFVWCGPSLGWLPENATASLHHRLYRSVEEAQEDADRYVTWPLRTGPGEFSTRLRQIGAN